MIKAQFLVPTHDNEGNPFSRRQWQALHERLDATFNGFSRRNGVHGQWEGYRDLSREYTVALPGWLHVPRLLALVQWVRVEFKQEAIYIEIQGVPEIVSGDLP